MCQDIALDARKMYEAGMTVPEIQSNIKAKYGRFQSQ
jgi:hypothetical protein